MFEWLDLDKLVFTGAPPIPFRRGDLCGVASSAKIDVVPRRNWRSIDEAYHYYVVGVGTRVLVQPGIQAVSFMVRDYTWNTVPFKFKPDGTGTQTFDEKLVYSIRKHGWGAEDSLTPGGIPWELALISDLTAQAAAVHAWREEMSYLSAM